MDLDLLDGDGLDDDLREGTVTAIGRLLAGGEKTTIEATDGRGTRNLIEAAERSGVARFVYLSYAGLTSRQRFPLAKAKWAAEEWAWAWKLISEKYAAGSVGS